MRVLAKKLLIRLVNLHTDLSNLSGSPLLGRIMAETKPYQKTPSCCSVLGIWNLYMYVDFCTKNNYIIFWFTHTIITWRLYFLNPHLMTSSLWKSLISRSVFAVCIWEWLVFYTANVLTIKTTGTGKSGAPAGKICTIYGKGL